MKKFTLMLLLAVTSFNTYAEEKVDKKLAIEYLTISRYEEVVNASIKQYEVQLFSAAKPEDKAKIHEMLEGALGWEATKDQLANIVMNLYTKNEIEASIAFMKSPAGASATAKSEEFSIQFTNAVSANLQKVLTKCCATKK
jgi:hypothetical protein